MSVTHIFLPPLRKPTGGLAVLHQVAAHLHAEGFPVRLVPREAAYWAPALSAAVPVTPWADLHLAPDDIWLVPEGWVNGLAPGLSAGARCVVYVQNWAYLFSALPEGVTWDRLPVSFIAVSDPVAWFMRETIGVEAPVLRPGIDLSLFTPPTERPDSPVRIAFMPRKNKALAAQIRAGFEARAARRAMPPVEWVAIDGLPPEGVARTLRESHVFLVTGYPEGCPLPPLEAMACGALCVGFAGLGGFDYMRNAATFPGAAEPWFPLRPTPWTGNGLWVADADVMAAVNALETAVTAVASHDPRVTNCLAAALDTAHHYGIETQRRSAAALWQQLSS
ncbi:hypothetical protein GGQ74_002481 [Desulfobaculum xiamenense]|uniref:Glycosyl transferases group 1 n=1 Tax=Desulfobaculum xiamenense TaxID=995050 RepID=A0A846QKU6_9BACT|nr:glycosyltransferase family 4 protein [Desulfobaculum xiamenense]NJB68808.1 hypothetical protein [Desulfobaculum xiamenense]